MKKVLNKKPKINITRGINILGNVLIAICILILMATFTPIISEEVKYQSGNIYQEVSKKINPNYTKETIFDPTPPDSDFSIVVPKIRAKSKIVVNVDPTDSDVFLKALKRGVAHASNTSLPGQNGNVYLFAHSTDAFYNVNYFNAVFYLIGKLNYGDEIYIYYNNTKYTYSVYDKKVVDAKNVEYLNNPVNEKILTLQTCYPPGTTLKRLVVLAKQVGNQ